MNKYYGNIGFVEFVETSLDIWEEQIVDRAYYGDILKNSRRWSGGEGINDDLTISNRISIISDKYLRENLQNIRYIEWNHVKWKVTSIEVNYPRVIFDVGKVFNENEA